MTVNQYIILNTTQSFQLFVQNVIYFFIYETYCGEGGVVQRSLQREKDSGDSGK